MNTGSFSAFDTYDVPKGMSREIWIDKYSRVNGTDADGRPTYQSWLERISEVVRGNFLLDPRPLDDPQRTRDFNLTMEVARRGLYAMSGRHLQHGDLEQPDKIGEVMTNCATSAFSWLQFLLLMKGSGVGRCYDSDAHFVNLDYLPNCRFVLSSRHPDYQDWIESLEEAQHKYDTESEAVRWFTVDDSAEGWAKIVMIMETAAFHRNNRDTTFVFDLTAVRERGRPIRGQQNRPASGPVPLIRALHRVMTLKGLGWKPWKQALFCDHALADCVLSGGIRRSARLSTKYWKDRDVIEFIDIKRGGWLYTSNNSITVDAEFWKQAMDPRPSHGRRVFEAAIAAAYYDQTGEPGFINIDKLTWSNEGIEEITAASLLESKVILDKFGKLHRRTYQMTEYILYRIKAKKYPYTCNPCAEQTLASYGGYCTVGDACWAYARTKQDAIDSALMVAQSLIRVNRMNFIYAAETKRTNRIGVSIAGIFEFMWNVFGITVLDAVAMDDDVKLEVLDSYTRRKVIDFWSFMAEVESRVRDHVKQLALQWGMNTPHTYVTMKPGGTLPKIMNCTESANPPSMPYYLRWVQFRRDSTALQDFTRRGYPVRDISRSEVRVNDLGEEYTVNGYKDTVIVGFPTRMRIAEAMRDKLVSARDMTVEDYYAWLRLLEKYFMGGPGNGTQVSITIKYDPKKVSADQFMDIVLRNQSTIRCAAVMPQADVSAYIYTPEESITAERYEELMRGIDAAEREAVDMNSLNCEGGACGIDENVNPSVVDA